MDVKTGPEPFMTTHGRRLLPSGIRIALNAIMFQPDQKSNQIYQAAPTTYCNLIASQSYNCS